MRRVNIRAHVRSIHAASVLSDRDLLACLSDSVLSAAVPYAIPPGERTALRTVHVPDDLADAVTNARLRLKHGTTFGDVLDWLLGSPPKPKSKRNTTIQVHLYEDDLERIRAAQRSGLTFGKIVARASEELSYPDVPPNGRETLRHSVGVTGEVATAWRQKGWTRYQQAEVLRRAIDVVELLPSSGRPRSNNWNEICLTRDTFDLLRGFTHEMRQKREDVILHALEFSDPTQTDPSYGRKHQVHLRWTPEQAARLPEGRHPAAVVESALRGLFDRWSEQDQEKVRSQIRNTHQCWPRGRSW